MRTLEKEEKAVSRSDMGRRLLQYENKPILLVLVVMIGVVVLIEYFMKGRINFLSGMNISNVLLQVSETVKRYVGGVLVMILGVIDW